MQLSALHTTGSRCPFRHEQIYACTPNSKVPTKFGAAQPIAAESTVMTITAEMASAKTCAQ